MQVSKHFSSSRFLLTFFSITHILLYNRQQYIFGNKSKKESDLQVDARQKGIIHMSLLSRFVSFIFSMAAVYTLWCLCVTRNTLCNFLFVVFSFQLFALFFPTAALFIWPVQDVLSLDSCLFMSLNFYIKNESLFIILYLIIVPCGLT